MLQVVFACPINRQKNKGCTEVQSLFVCTRGKSPNDLPAFPWVDAVSFAVPVALADVDKLKMNAKPCDVPIQTLY